MSMKSRVVTFLWDPEIINSGVSDTVTAFDISPKRLMELIDIVEEDMKEYHEVTHSNMFNTADGFTKHVGDSSFTDKDLLVLAYAGYVMKTAVYDALHAKNGGIDKLLSMLGGLK